MMITEKNRTTSVVVLILVALNGLFLFGNGLFMLVVPSEWYHFVPGVTNTYEAPGCQGHRPPLTKRRSP
jgi:hypothetical protein